MWLNERMADEIWRWDAGRIAAAIASREISARDAIEALSEPDDAA